MSTIIILTLIFLYVLALYLSSRKGNLDKIFSIFHFLGGLLWAALFSQFMSGGALIVFLVFLVGLLWEFYEYLTGKIAFLRNFFKKYLGIAHLKITTKDTIYDLFFDVIGAAVFVLISGI